MCKTYMNLDSEEPIYVLKMDEAVLVPVEKRKVMILLRKCVWGIIIALVLFSLILGENLFSELHWTAKIVLISLVIRYIFLGSKEEFAPSPMELQFYEDHLVMYLPKRYYDSKVTRKRTNTFMYKDITKCVYVQRIEMIEIHGNGTSVWYNYKRDGSLPKEPTANRTFKGGKVYFNIRFANEQGIDVIKEIEEHSPIKVTIE